MERILKLVQDAVRCLDEFDGEIRKAEEVHEGEFLENESEDYNSARILIDGLVSSIFLKANEPVTKINLEGEYQLLLGASFIRTHFCLHDLIINGHLMEGHVLLRKQLESLARLNELESQGVDELKGKTPNIKHAPLGEAGPIYGVQSKIAHFSAPDVGINLLQTYNSGNIGVVTGCPKYSENSKYCMNSRLYLALEFSMWFTVKLWQWYPKKNFDLLNTQLVGATDIAIKAGILAKQS